MFYTVTFGCYFDDGRFLKSTVSWRAEKKLDNSPGQALTASIRPSGDSKVDCVSRWTLEQWEHLRTNEATEAGPSEHAPSSRTLGRHQSHPPSTGTDTARLLEAALSPFSPNFPRYREKRRLETVVSSTFPHPLTLSTLISDPHGHAFFFMM